MVDPLHNFILSCVEIESAYIILRRLLSLSLSKILSSYEILRNPVTATRAFLWTVDGGDSRQLYFRMSLPFGNLSDARVARSERAFEKAL